MTHRGILHHLIITVSSVARSGPFYTAVLSHLGYELSGSSKRFQDWKRWDLDSPHELSIVEASANMTGVPYAKGAVGHHHHLAFCALDRADVDRFHADVLVPLEARGLCTIEAAPCDCPEYGDGYYATFFRDPDGLKYEFVINPDHLKKRRERPSKPDKVAPPTNAAEH
jgi:catechol 2,3-dioxygenase-like lactoylglutathione lyase family enzyme